MDTLMQPTQALALATCLLDYEIEEPSHTPVPPDWLAELRQARVILGDLLNVFERMPPRRPEPTAWADLPEVMSTTEVAQALNLYRNTVPRLIKEGRIPATREGRRYRIRRDELRAAVESGSLSAPKKRRRRRPARQTHPELGF